jgi:hypothetical protein
MRAPTDGSSIEPSFGGWVVSAIPKPLPVCGGHGPPYALCAPQSTINQLIHHSVGGLCPPYRNPFHCTAGMARPTRYARPNRRFINRTIIRWVGCVRHTTTPSGVRRAMPALRVMRAPIDDKPSAPSSVVRNILPLDAPLPACIIGPIQSTPTCVEASSPHLSAPESRRLV